MMDVDLLTISCATEGILFTILTLVAQKKSAFKCILE